MGIFFFPLLIYYFSYFKRILNTQSGISQQAHLGTAEIFHFATLILFFDFLKLNLPVFQTKNLLFKKKIILKQDISTLLEIISFPLFVLFEVDWPIKTIYGVKNIVSAKQKTKTVLTKMQNESNFLLLRINFSPLRKLIVKPTCPYETSSIRGCFLGNFHAPCEVPRLTSYTCPYCR